MQLPLKSFDHSLLALKLATQRGVEVRCLDERLPKLWVHHGDIHDSATGQHNLWLILIGQRPKKPADTPVIHRRHVHASPDAFHKIDKSSSA